MLHRIILCVRFIENTHLFTMLLSGCLTLGLSILVTDTKHKLVNLRLFIFSIANSHENLVFDKPYCRIAPYLIGMLLGYMLYKYGATKRRIGKVSTESDNV